MPDHCTHLKDIRDASPSALGCEECLKTGDVWVHLRICRTCKLYDYGRHGWLDFQGRPTTPTGLHEAVSSDRP